MHSWETAVRTITATWRRQLQAGTASHGWHILVWWSVGGSKLGWLAVAHVSKLLIYSACHSKDQGVGPLSLLTCKISLESCPKSVLEAWKLPKEKVSCGVQPCEDGGRRLALRVIWQLWMRMHSLLVCVWFKKGRSAQSKICVHRKERVGIWIQNLLSFAILLAFQEATAKPLKYSALKIQVCVLKCHVRVRLGPHSSRFLMSLQASVLKASEGAEEVWYIVKSYSPGSAQHLAFPWWRV